MPVFVVTGASRGLGYAFVKVLVADSENTVIGIVRDRSAAEEKLAKDGLQSVHVFQADITDRTALKAAAEEIQNQFGAVDYLICNAGYLSAATRLRNLAEFADRPEDLEAELERAFRVNVIGLINTINIFIDLVQASSVRKVIALTSGNGSCDFVTETGLDTNAPVAISKAALNMVIAKYDATYRDVGILFMGICAGIVNTQESNGVPLAITEKDKAKMQKVWATITSYAPNHKGPVSPEDGAKQLLKVIYSASLSEGSGGRSVSWSGSTTRWL